MSSITDVRLDGKGKATAEELEREYRDDPHAEFGGYEGRVAMEKKLLRKLDARSVVRSP